ncbi:hypothetical protein H5410_010820, partial [Solanum commersonii]
KTPLFHFFVPTSNNGEFPERLLLIVQFFLSSKLKFKAYTNFIFISGCAFLDNQ